MDERYCLFSVDDDPMMQAALAAVLEPEFEVEAFASAEDCRARLAARRPDMFLLDIDLPGIDGYDLCREIKADPQTQGIPVTFVSSHDGLDERLAGYAAGGMDFVVKPFDAAEVLRKVRVAACALAEKRGLLEQAAASEQLASMVLESIDEYGLVLQFLGKAIACDTALEVAEAMQHLLRGYRLEGAVQVRVGEAEITLGAAGPSSPLETSIVNHVRTLGRLFEFKRNSVHNFERVTVLVGNMPLDKAEFCGRVRDNLNMAAQGADARLLAIQTDEADRRKQAGIFRVLDSLRGTLGALTEGHRRERLQGATLSFEMQQGLAKSFVHLGLTSGQEAFLEEMVRGYMDRLASLYDSGEQTQDVLERLGRELELLTAG